MTRNSDSQPLADAVEALAAFIRDRERRAHLRVRQGRRTWENFQDASQVKAQEQREVAARQAKRVQNRAQDLLDDAQSAGGDLLDSAARVAHDLGEGLSATVQDLGAEVSSWWDRASNWVKEEGAKVAREEGKAQAEPQPAADESISLDGLLEHLIDSMEEQRTQAGEETARNREKAAQAQVSFVEAMERLVNRPVDLARERAAQMENTAPAPTVPVPADSSAASILDALGEAQAGDSLPLVVLVGRSKTRMDQVVALARGAGHGVVRFSARTPGDVAASVARFDQVERGDIVALDARQAGDKALAAFAPLVRGIRSQGAIMVVALDDDAKWEKSDLGGFSPMVVHI